MNIINLTYFILFEKYIWPSKSISLGPVPVQIKPKTGKNGLWLHPPDDCQLKRNGKIAETCLALPSSKESM